MATEDTAATAEGMAGWSASAMGAETEPTGGRGSTAEKT
jgi:hypothetical protein